MQTFELKPTLTMLIGLPRAGKTTYIEDNKDGVVVSADQLRYLVYGQRFWGPGEPLMWSIRDIMLRSLMKQGVNIIIDETNTTQARRKPILGMAKEYGYLTRAVYIPTSKEVCIKRALDEGEAFLVSVIERMHNQFEPVSEEEGFDQYWTGGINNDGNKTQFINK